MSRLTLAEHREALAAYLPVGKVWANKRAPGSNLYGILAGFAPSFLRMDQSIEDYEREANPFTTVKYLEEWEETLAIPDDCIPLAETIELRQFYIALKMRTLLGVQTREDFKAIAAIFGFDYEFHSGIEHVPTSESGYGLYLPELTIAGGDFADLTEARHTLVVVEGDSSSINFGNPPDDDGTDGDGWQFPLGFSAEGQNTLRCVLSKLKPANCQIVFVEEE